MTIPLAPSRPTFGALLRSWRVDRRWSQADLAHAIETPARHVSFMETGRANPSREMVTRLASALQIPLRDRNLLLKAAGFADLYPDHALEEAQMGMLREAVSRMMNAHDPYPAFVVDRAWFVREANGSGRRMLARVGDAFPFDPPHTAPNMLDITFSPNGIRPMIENWDDYARQAIQRIHREALSPADLRTALERVGRHPDLPKDWWALDVRYAHDPVFPIRIRTERGVMRFFAVITAIAVPTGSLAQELRVETLFPGNEDTERALRQTVSPSRA